jgi:RNA polymerase sigma-70 factor, ECF subfamily
MRMNRQMDTDEVTDWVEGLHDRFGGGLLLFAYRSLGDWQAAQEVVQDTLVRAWRSAERYDPDRAALGTWLYAIARNLVIDQQRRRAARPQVLEAEPDTIVDDSPAALDRALEAWQVAEALQALSSDHRAAILETYYRGLSVAEAAERLGIPPGTVKSRVYYGLRSLRLVLEERGVVG